MKPDEGLNAILGPGACRDILNFFDDKHWWQETRCPHIDNGKTLIEVELGTYELKGDKLTLNVTAASCPRTHYDDNGVGIRALAARSKDGDSLTLVTPDAKGNNVAIVYDRKNDTPRQSGVTGCFGDSGFTLGPVKNF